MQFIADHFFARPERVLAVCVLILIAMFGYMTVSMDLENLERAETPSPTETSVPTSTSAPVSVPTSVSGVAAAENWGDFEAAGLGCGCAAAAFAATVGLYLLGKVRRR